MIPLTMDGVERPDILWLDAEDLSPDLGCYGAKIVQTPNIDGLAKNGVRFDNAFVTGPVCSASRSAVITGMYQTTIGAHNHRGNRDKPLPAEVKLVTEYLRSAGYFTCNGQALEGDKKGKMDYNFRMSFNEAFDGTDWSQRKHGQPFFAEVHFSEAHRAFTRDPDNPIDPTQVEIPPYYPDHPITRMDWALYLETIQNLDKKVGHILKRLEDENLVDNTVVFLWGDHGRAMVRGKQFVYDEGIRIPLIIRWPGHVKPSVNDDLVSTIDLAPTWLQLAGLEVPRHMQGRSLFQRQEQERGYIFAARDRCDETVDRVRCVRTKRYKYIRNFFPNRPYAQFNAYKKRHYPVLTLMEVMHDRGELTPKQALFMASHRPGEELYDLRKDPHELHNFVQDPNSQNVLETMRGRLEMWMRKTKDQGGKPEEDSVLRFWEEDSKVRFDMAMRDRGLQPDISPKKYLKWWEANLRVIHKS